MAPANPCASDEGQAIPDTGVPLRRGAVHAPRAGGDLPRGSVFHSIGFYCSSDLTDGNIRVKFTKAGIYLDLCA